MFLNTTGWTRNWVQVSLERSTGPSIWKLMSPSLLKSSPSKNCRRNKPMSISWKMNWKWWNKSRILTFAASWTSVKIVKTITSRLSWFPMAIFCKSSHKFASKGSVLQSAMQQVWFIKSCWQWATFMRLILCIGISSWRTLWFSWRGKAKPLACHARWLILDLHVSHKVKVWECH